MKLKVKKRYIAITGAAAFGLLVAAQPVSAQDIWSAGHGDIGLEYEGPGTMEPTWHLGEDNETVILNGVPTNFGTEGQEFEPDEIIAFSNRVESRAAGAAWDPTGVVEGAPLYVFPQTNDPTVPFLGFGLEELDPGDWLSNIEMTLTGLSGGTGDFSVYTTDNFGVPTFLMASSDGISAADVVSQAAGTHEHYNWVFSEKGTYDVTFEFSGLHITDGVQSQSATYTFTVVPEPSRAMLAAAGLCGMILQRRRRA
ncbi:MAG: choice-of-anchor M domain-containing protein [Verrucomicrobiota bacterium]